MAWETRGKRRYYYRKVRWNGGVLSQYVGAGLLADAVAELERAERLEEQARQEAWRAEVEAERAAEKDLDRIGDLMRTLTTAVLLVNNCYAHRRQWRRRRATARRRNAGEEKVIHE